jgi:hypothetical protein
MSGMKAKSFFNKNWNSIRQQKPSTSNFKIRHSLFDTRYFLYLVPTLRIGMPPLDALRPEASTRLCFDDATRSVARR